MVEVENVSKYVHSVIRDAFLSGDFNDYSQQIADEDKPKPWQTWVIGLAIVTASAIAAPLGMLLIPLLSKSLYDRFMVFLVALGIGAMSGSVLFILIPQAYNLTDLEDFSYSTKSIIVISAIYGFFAVDRFLQIFLELRRRRCSKRKIHIKTLKSIINDTKEKRRKKKEQKRLKKLCAVNDNCVDIEKEKDDLRNEFEVQMITNNIFRNLSTRRRVGIVQVEENNNKLDEIKYRSNSGSFVDMDTLRHHNDSDSDNDVDGETSQTTISSTVGSTPTESQKENFPVSMNPDNSTTTTIPKKDSEVELSVQVVESKTLSKPEIANVAYMIIFGSSANNFVDGMSTGAAFSDSISKGLSIGLAVISQQFPQELGTLAILVKSGLGLKRTLLFNLIPMILSYAGFGLGVILDNVNEGYDEYIYSISSGMYFYIFLGTLIPEIRDTVTETLKSNFAEAILTTFLQFSGIIFGVLFMYFMSRFGSE